jgi:hypothetical protein
MAWESWTSVITDAHKGQNKISFYHLKTDSTKSTGAFSTLSVEVWTQEIWSHVNHAVYFLTPYTWKKLEA